VIAEELLAGLPFRVARTLGQYANPPADLGGPGMGDARDRERAARRREDRGQNPDRGRLARSVRSQHAQDLAGLDLEAEVVDGDDRTESLLDSVCLDGCGHDGGEPRARR
jgi:hypothetical protein